MKADKRQWQPREMRLVAEYLEKTYSKYPYQMRVRLGSIPDQLITEDMSPEERRSAGIWRRWADAIVFKPRSVVIIEAKIRPSPGDISQLQLYAELFGKTPELQPYTARPLALELLYAIPDPVIEHRARQANIKVTHFKPAWVDDYLAILEPRKRRAPLSGGG